MEIGWLLAVALGILIVGGMVVSAAGRLPVARSIPWAAVRAGVQLSAVTLVVGRAAARSPALRSPPHVPHRRLHDGSAQRTQHVVGTRPAVLAMLAGALPVLVIIFASGVALNGPAIVPIASILVGNVMTAHTLVGRRAFADLREGIDQYEAYLALGYWRSQAIHRVVSPNLHEALIPALDQTWCTRRPRRPARRLHRRVARRRLPLGRGAAQILVLVGINTGQAAVAVTARLPHGAHLAASRRPQGATATVKSIVGAPAPIHLSSSQLNQSRVRRLGRCRAGGALGPSAKQVLRARSNAKRSVMPPT